LEGTRNHQVNRASLALGRLVAAGELDEAEVREQLTAPALTIGLSSTETERTMNSGLEAGKSRPRTMGLVP
jgi:hypothetical protein